MPCIHKFHAHPEHLTDNQGLLPKWKANTLIIGTFNPEHDWHPTNMANYFYGRRRNYLWKILPRFAGLDSIAHADVDAQIVFLDNHKIALTDLLIRINDADLDNEEHVRRIRTVLDDELERFTNFEWNTPHIQTYLAANDIQTVYFTKLGKPLAGLVDDDTFEGQMRKIELTCLELGIPSYRLHTPSGNGLGTGRPKHHNLIRRWYTQNGADNFPFLSQDFDVENFPVDI